MVFHFVARHLFVEPATVQQVTEVELVRLRFKLLLELWPGENCISLEFLGVTDRVVVRMERRPPGGPRVRLVWVGKHGQERFRLSATNQYCQSQ